MTKGDRKFGGAPRYNGGTRFEKRAERFDRPELFPARCAECDASCKVPFRPDSGKTAYCRDCFKGVMDSWHGRGDDRKSFRTSSRPASRSYGSDRQSYEATCDGCHAKCDLPFRPNGSKPVYCRECFRKEGDVPQQPGASRRKTEGRPIDDPRWAEVHSKLDVIMRELAELKRGRTAVVAEDLGTEVDDTSL
jgi:CxxC-x17-CxxC domain-containing protein